MKKIVRVLKGITKLLFSRTTFVIFAVLLQLSFLVVTVGALSEYYIVFNIAFGILGLGTAIYIMNEDVNSAFKIVWLVPVLVIPAFGVVAFLLLRKQPETMRNRSRLERMDMQLKECVLQNEAVLNELRQESDGERGIANYLYNVGSYPVYSDNDIEFFPLGEYKFEAMLEDLRNAKKFIFMEYFIVAEGHMWNSILEILKQKAKDGVEVRFLYDGMNSIRNLPYGYYKDLREFGIKVHVYEKLRPVLTTCQNNRDHRKILIIDGEKAYTGGINLADEYINRLERFGHWKDTAIRVKGDAVASFTYMFLQMWYLTKKKSSILKQDIDDYITNVTHNSRNVSNKNGYVIPYADSPYDSKLVSRQVYIDILNRATEYVHIMTPYLILDDDMVDALKYCADRGVETVIIMPHVPDKVYAYLLARSYYKDLIQAGVKIFEYTKGFVHAKEFISDGVRATVGTANLDFRSLYLHFECGAYIYNNKVVESIEKDFENTIRECEQIDIKNCNEYSKFKMFIGKVLRFIAPLM